MDKDDPPESPKVVDGLGIIDGEIWIPDRADFLKCFPGFIAFSTRDWQIFGFDRETLKWVVIEGDSRKGARIRPA